MYLSGLSIRQLRRMVIVVILLVLTLTAILIYRQTVRSDDVDLYVKHSPDWHGRSHSHTFDRVDSESSVSGHQPRRDDNDERLYSDVASSKVQRRKKSRQKDKRTRHGRYRTNGSIYPNVTRDRDDVSGSGVSRVGVSSVLLDGRDVHVVAVNTTRYNQQQSQHARQNVVETVQMAEVFNDGLGEQEVDVKRDSENSSLLKQTVVASQAILPDVNAIDSAGQNKSDSSIVGSMYLSVQSSRVFKGTAVPVDQPRKEIGKIPPDTISPDTERTRESNSRIEDVKSFNVKMTSEPDGAAARWSGPSSTTTTWAPPAEEPEEVLLSSGKKPTGSFVSDLELVADFNRRVVISVVDSGYVPMAVNFHRISVKTVGLKNFLMICTDREAVELLLQQGVACSLYLPSPLPPPAAERVKLMMRNNSRTISSGPDGHERSVSFNAKQASNYGTHDYYQKSNVKTTVVMEVLRLGYAVLIIDVDVVLFKDPFPFFNCTECDAHFSMDREMFNSGFAYIRPTVGSKQLYQTAWNLYSKYQKAHDQVYINMAVTRLNQQQTTAKRPFVHIQALSVQLFPCGAYYFARDHRMFENQPACPNCVMAHNNYIGSAAAKIYRFKENLLWTLDDDMYYSNKSARYFTYDNPYDFGSDTVRMETDALKSALSVAMATGRILILPTFRCCSVNCQSNSDVLMPILAGASNLRKSGVECSDPRHRCSLLSVLRLTKFDRAFANYYREHSFLSNRRVPESIKTGASKFRLFINSSDSTIGRQPQALNVSNSVIVTPVNREKGASLTEVVRWFEERADETVIRFHSLYGTSVDWQSDRTPLSFKLKKYFEVGFECSEYEQWDSNLLNLSKMWPGK